MYLIDVGLISCFCCFLCVRVLLGGSTTGCYSGCYACLVVISLGFCLLCFVLYCCVWLFC